ncbi:MAG: hypothetical protein AB7V50_06975 [Vampirovibrionia bacterium]
MNNITSPVIFTGDIKVNLRSQKDNDKYNKAIENHGFLDKLTHTQNIKARVDALPDSFQINVENTDKGKVKAVLTLKDNPLFKLSFTKGKFDFISDFLNQVVNFATLQRRNILERSDKLKDIVEQHKDVIPDLANVLVNDPDVRNDFIWALMQNETKVKTLPDSCYINVTDSHSLNPDKEPEMIVYVGDNYAIPYRKSALTTNIDLVNEVSEIIQRPLLYDKALVAFTQPDKKLPDNVQVMTNPDYFDDARKEISKYLEHLAILPDGCKFAIKQNVYVHKGQSKNSSDKCPNFGLTSYLIKPDGEAVKLHSKGSYETFKHFVRESVIKAVY